MWTVDDTRRARALRAEGVGTIISDVPVTLRAALALPSSGCTLSRYRRTTVLRCGATLGPGARFYLKAPRTGPAGRVVESTSVKVTARTLGGTVLTCP